MLIFMLAVMTLLWAVNPIVAKVALREFPVLTLTQLRVVLAAAILWPVFWLQMAPGELARLKEEWKTLLVLSFFGVGVNQLFFVGGMKNTSVAHASIIMSMTPVYVLIV